MTNVMAILFIIVVTMIVVYFANILLSSTKIEDDDETIEIEIKKGVPTHLEIHNDVKLLWEVRSIREASRTLNISEYLIRKHLLSGEILNGYYFKQA